MAVMIQHSNRLWLNNMYHTDRTINKEDNQYQLLSLVVSKENYFGFQPQVLGRILWCLKEIRRILAPRPSIDVKAIYTLLFTCEQKRSPPSRGMAQGACSLLSSLDVSSGQLNKIHLRHSMQRDVSEIQLLPYILWAGFKDR